MGSHTSAYWWKQKPNFGDTLGPHLLDHFSNLQVYWSPPDEASLVCTGSILDLIPAGWEGTILGSGRLRPEIPLHIEDARILALRGPLSARGVKGDYALGDPGLLANELVEIDTRRYDLGILPHWSDRQLAHDPRFTKYNHLIIDPAWPTLDVVRAIGQCRKLVSSSLHGLIVADSFSIPRRFEYTPRFDAEGGLFKFEDYSLAVGTPLRIGESVVASRFAVDDRKSELYDAFREIEVR